MTAQTLMEQDADRGACLDGVAAAALRAGSGRSDEELAAYVRRYYARMPLADLALREPGDLAGAALAHLRTASQRAPGQPAVRDYAPTAEADGWHSWHDVVEIVTDDMPFLVDSVTMELVRHGNPIQLVVHPVLVVRRDSAGRLLEVLDVDPAQAPPDAKAESFLRAEVDRLPDEGARQGLVTALRRVLAEVSTAVEDWGPMRDRAGQAADDLERTPPPLDPAAVAETAAFLRWLRSEHFAFLGAVDYTLTGTDDDDELRVVPGSQLGVLRVSGRQPASQRLRELPEDQRRLSTDARLLVLAKSGERATVHRTGYLDHVGLKVFDSDGRLVGERRFLGLYAAAVYEGDPHAIPVVRRTLAEVERRLDFAPASHDAKALVAALTSMPRDELFQSSADDLEQTIVGVLGLQERQRVRLFVRPDDFGRFWSCLVYVPRDRYTTVVRRKIQQVLVEAFGGRSSDLTARMSDSVLARLHVVVHTDAGQRPEVDLTAVQEQLEGIVRTWAEDLQTALLAEYGEERGAQLGQRYASAFPIGYRDMLRAEHALDDVARMERLAPSGDLAVHLDTVPEETTYTDDVAAVEVDAPPADADLRLRIYRTGGPLTLSDVLPMLESTGVTVLDVRPIEVRRRNATDVYLYDFGLKHPGAATLVSDGTGARFEEALLQVWRGEAENDGFNRLVLAAGLSGREVSVLRACAKYLRQTATTFSQAYMEASLAKHPHIARLLVALFAARHDPGRRSTPEGAAEAQQEADTLTAAAEEALEAVDSLDEDRILRAFLAVVVSTLRTNAYQSGPDGRPKPYLSLKLDSAGVPDLPRPLPAVEVFVYSPRVEAVHLRGGRVSRGGIRWSDRREDFRTEVLGLMKAQRVKNAVIVPVGAKGGFVVQRPPADRDALAEEVVTCYRTFIRGLLDVTDNLIEGTVVPPEQVVRHDGDDPYLVVAADKGTARFSDVANAISADYGFWLGDAFASGGSVGYDHKAMGITARGAWVSVRRHFAGRGVDIDSDPFTVVGVGDMSGDVFGNGMLLSPMIRLVGAFDHRHVFLDPDPDPAVSHAERQRLYDLPGSSWADYNPGLISAGGGVFPRTAKSIPLSPQVRAALDIEADHLAPAELIRAILRAPVGLLWNGGIGTYVKASTESHADVGDKTNDAVRVDTSELRCQVVGEGGNLGLTQRARIQFALAGGLVNTDAIDNSAGVDCSDHEVNIKILLDRAIAAGALPRVDREPLLASMTDEVAELVLRDNDAQVRALANARAQAPAMVDVHARYLRRLELTGTLDRELEALPSRKELIDRATAGLGLTAPEFAVLLAYTKNSLYGELMASDVPEDAYLSRELETYFPTPLRERLRTTMQDHPLRREIVATRIANTLVDRAGMTVTFRLGEETGASAADITRAHTVAREVFGLRALWAETEALDNVVGAEVQVAVVLEARLLAERATRWLLRSCPQPLSVAATIEDFAGVGEVAERLPVLLVGSGRTAVSAARQRYVDAGVPERLAERVAGLDMLFGALDVVKVARESDSSVSSVAGVYYLLGDRLRLDWLRASISALPRDDRWRGLARAALRDDLYAERRTLTADILGRGAKPTPPDVLLEAWSTRRAGAVERYLQVLSDIEAGEVIDLTTLSVALRSLRGLRDSR